MFSSLAYLVVLFLSQCIRFTVTRDSSCDVNIPSRPMPQIQEFGLAFALSDIKPTVCGEGEYLDWFTCRPCQDGTFMTQKMIESNHHHCQRCYQPGMYEIVVEPCTKTRDAKIMCEDGYFRCEVPGKPCQSECRRCDVCGLGINMFKNFEVRECSGYDNTICCPLEDMEYGDGGCVIKRTEPTTTTKYNETTLKLTSTTTESTGSHSAYSSNNGNSFRQNLSIYLFGLFCLYAFDIHFGIS